MTSQQEVDTIFSITENVPRTETGQTIIDTRTPVSTSVALDRRQVGTDPNAPVTFAGQVVNYTVTF